MGYSPHSGVPPPARAREDAVAFRALAAGGQDSMRDGIRQGSGAHPSAQAFCKIVIRQQRTNAASAGAEPG